MPKASSYLGFHQAYPTKTVCTCPNAVGSQDEDGDYSCVLCGRHLERPSQPTAKPYKAQRRSIGTFTRPEHGKPLEAEASAQGTLF